MVNPCGFFNVIVPAPNPYFLCNPLNVKSPSEPHSNHGCLQQAPPFLLISPAYHRLLIPASCLVQSHLCFVETTYNTNLLQKDFQFKYITKIPCCPPQLVQ
ncbi:hypothetical protein GOODEAATRI_033574 [Goodea atripinnis]|uniref:Uncharacterized protein n=1 Tax=Goodea atripinnis TaxID=208336 RepID=A0ABV0NQC2_9TELE